MRSLTPYQLTIVASLAGLNTGVGVVVQLLKLPIYLDLIGSFIAVALFGPFVSTIVAIIGVVIMGLTVNPTAFAYGGTAIIVTLLASLFHKWGFLQRISLTIFFGALLGIASALASAPVTVIMFGGVSFVGADAATAFVRALGNDVWTSVISAGIFTDIVDKISSSLIAFYIIQNIPRNALAKIQIYGA